MVFSVNAQINWQVESLKNFHNENILARNKRIKVKKTYGKHIYYYNKFETFTANNRWGVLTKIDSFDINGVKINSVLYSQKSITIQKYQYNEKGRLIVTIIKQDSQLDTITYTYLNNKISEISGCNSFEFFYDNKGNLIKVLERKRKYTLSENYIYIYNDDGTYIRRDTLHTIFEQTYNEKGKLQEQLYLYKEERVPYITKHLYHYNKNGSLDSVTIYTKKEGELKFSKNKNTERFYYNSKEQLIREKRYYQMGENHYTYNRKGLLEIDYDYASYVTRYEYEYYSRFEVFKYMFRNWLK